MVPLRRHLAHPRTFRVHARAGDPARPQVHYLVSHRRDRPSDRSPKADRIRDRWVVARSRAVGALMCPARPVVLQHRVQQSERRTDFTQ
jgi:hypothetical protein